MRLLVGTGVLLGVQRAGLSLTFGLRMAGEQSLLCGIGHCSVIAGKVAARAALAHRSLDGEVWRGLG